LFSRFLSPHLEQKIVSPAGCCGIVGRVVNGRGVNGGFGVAPGTLI
jgi:hypothetical protein